MITRFPAPYATHRCGRSKLVDMVELSSVVEHMNLHRKYTISELNIVLLTNNIWTA